MNCNNYIIQNDIINADERLFVSNGRLFRVSSIPIVYINKGSHLRKWSVYVQRKLNNNHGFCQPARRLSPRGKRGSHSAREERFKIFWRQNSAIRCYASHLELWPFCNGPGGRGGEER